MNAPLSPWHRGRAGEAGRESLTHRVEIDFLSCGRISRGRAAARNADTFGVASEDLRKHPSGVTRATGSYLRACSTTLLSTRTARSARARGDLFCVAATHGSTSPNAA